MVFRLRYHATTDIIYLDDVKKSADIGEHGVDKMQDAYEVMKPKYIFYNAFGHFFCSNN